MTPLHAIMIDVTKLFGLVIIPLCLFWPIWRMIDRTGVFWKAVVGFLQTPLFLLVCVGLIYEHLTMGSLGGIEPTLIFVTPFAMLATLLGGLAIHDIGRGKKWGLPLALFDVLVLPLASLNAMIIFLTLTMSGLIIEINIDPPDISRPQQGATQQERLHFNNSLIKMEYEHQERTERLTKNLATVITIPLILLSNFLIVRFFWRSLREDRPVTKAKTRSDQTWIEWWLSLPKPVRLGFRLFLWIGYLNGLLMFFSFGGESQPDRLVHEIGNPSPWLIVQAEPGNFNWSFQIGSFLIFPIIGLCCLFTDRALTYFENQKEESLLVHYVLWGFMLSVCSGVGLSLFVMKSNLIATSPHNAKMESHLTALASASFILAALLILGLAIVVWTIIVVIRQQLQTASPEKLIRGAAISLIACGILGGLVDLFLITILTTHGSPQQALNLMTGIYIFSLLIIRTLTVTAGFRLLFHCGRKLAIAAAFLIMIPHSIVFLLGLFVGIWTLTVLFRDDVKFLIVKEGATKSNLQTYSSHN